jgi:hypothetical protein
MLLRKAEFCQNMSGSFNLQKIILDGDFKVNLWHTFFFIPETDFIIFIDAI